MVLTKYLFTSCRNAALLMNMAGVAPGWLFGRGDFGWNRGKTLEEIMGVKVTCLFCNVRVIVAYNRLRHERIDLLSWKILR